MEIGNASNKTLIRIAIRNRPDRRRPLNQPHRAQQGGWWEKAHPLYGRLKQDLASFSHKRSDPKTTVMPCIFSFFFSLDFLSLAQDRPVHDFIPRPKTIPEYMTPLEMTKQIPRPPCPWKNMGINSINSASRPIARRRPIPPNRHSVPCERLPSKLGCISFLTLLSTCFSFAF